MNKLQGRLTVSVLFAAVIIVSIAMMIKGGDESSIETANTVSDMEEYVTDMTDGLPASADPGETKPPYAHDIDPEIASYFSSFYAAGTSETLPPEAMSGTAETENDITTPPAASNTAPVTSRTVITSRQRKDYDSNSVYIDMENILQNPELPVGCEITSLTILLRYYGFDAEKTDMARNYLPTSWGNQRTVDGKSYKDSFYDYFIGDPFSKGYGCFSPAIERAANSYISDHGGGVTVKNISGCHPDTLYEYLIAGTPVLCWATDGMIEPEYYETWYDNATGEQLDWYLNEHCFVLTGFNISAGTVTLNDPMKGIIDYNIDKFEVRFKQMHSQAIVIIPDSSEPVTETVTSIPESETVTEDIAAITETAEIFSETETAVTTTEIISPWTSETTFSETASQETDTSDTGDYTGEYFLD